MKQNTIFPALLWTANIAVLAGGGYLAYDFYSSQQDGRAQVVASVGSRIKKIEMPQTWDSLTLREAEIRFEPIRLQMGAKPKLPEPPPLNPIDGPKAEHYPDLSVIRSELERDMKDRVEVLRVVIMHPLLNTPSWVQINPKTVSGAAAFEARLGENLVKRFDPDNELQRQIAGSMPDADIIAFTPESVTFAVTNGKLEDAYKKWPKDKLAAQSQELQPVDGRMIIKVDVPLEEYGANPFVSTSKSPSVGPRTPTPVKGSPSEKIANIPPDPNAETPSQPKEWVEEHKKTSVRADGSVQLGGEEMTEDTFQDVARYAEIYIDPKTGRPAGLRVAENLPEGTSSLARRVGAMPGDIIKKINSQPVSNIQEVKNVVIQQRNAGVEQFVVEYNRNGVDRTQTFHLPKKKSK